MGHKKNLKTRLSAPSNTALAEISKLISIDTTSRNSNLPMIDYVAERLQDLGIEPVLVPNAEGTKANLLATFPAADGTRVGGIMLSGHTDVVPVDGQNWSSSPFTTEVREGRLYGRGACDMKSFLGTIVAKLRQISEARLSEPIHLAFSYDEEPGCIGAVDLVAAITAAGLKPRGCIVGEPSGMRVIRAHKSVNVIRVDFHGVAAHSSLTPAGVNAISAAAQFTCFVDSVAAEFRQYGPFDYGYVVPYTTTSVNRIDGGIAVNTIPADCTLHFEFRSLAAIDQQELAHRFRAECQRIETVMREHNPLSRVDFTVLASAPGLETPKNAHIVTLAAELGGIATADKVTYGTEAGLFANAGIHTVVCGPGDIAQAHAPDEFIELDQIARFESLIDKLITSLQT